MTILAFLFSFKQMRNHKISKAINFAKTAQLLNYKYNQQLNIMCMSFKITSARVRMRNELPVFEMIDLPDHFIS